MLKNVCCDLFFVLICNLIKVTRLGNNDGIKIVMAFNPVQTCLESYS